MPLSEEQSGRIHCLDGWRGIAILMVLIEHFQAAFQGHGNFHFGQHGVQLFFVLSGYLITAQLLREERINLKAFYVRRAFRILPPALLYLSVLVLLTAFTSFHVSGSDIWACLFFFRNYVAETAANTCTAHFWSLSLEEQFYLFWPALLVLLGRRKASFAAAGLAVAIAIFRYQNWSYYIYGLRALRTEVRADGLLVGCVLALALSHVPIQLWVKRYGMWLFWLGLAVFAFDLGNFTQFIPLHESMAIAVMLGSTSLRPETLVGRALEWNFLKTTGLLSYGIYIWQGLFLRSNWGGMWPVFLAMAVFISYVVVEQPARRLGRRIANSFTVQLKASPVQAFDPDQPELAVSQPPVQ